MWVRNNKGNVFVGNLPPDFPDERLAEAFDPYGIVLSAIVARDPDTGARLRYGFVDIATDKAANAAIAALDGTKIDGSKLNVKARDKPVKKPGAGPGRRPPPRTVKRVPRDLGEGSYAARPAMAHFEGDTPQQMLVQPSQGQMSQSQMAQHQGDMARADMPEIEPPPRQDFEVVRRPVRRKEVTFQVERRPLPRRLTLPGKP